MGYLLEDLLAGAHGLTMALLVSAAATLLSSAVSALGVLIGSKPHMIARRLALSLPPLLALAAFAIVIVWLVGDARAVIVDAVQSPGDDPGEAATRLASGLSLQVNGLALGSMLAVLVMPAGIVGGALPWALSRPPTGARAPLLAVAAGASLLLVTAAQAIASYAAEVIVAFGAVANADPATKARLLSYAMDEAGTSLDANRLVIGGAALIAALVGSFLAARAARAGAVAGTRTLIAAVAAAALGALALFGTRSMAHDAGRPLPGAAAGKVRFPSHLEPLFLARCEPLTATIPVLVVSEAVVRMDGRILATPQDATGDLEILRRNWSVLHPREPGPDAVGIASDERTAAAVIAPWLRAAQAAGFQHVEILSARVTTFESETLGTLERRATCSQGFTLDAEGAPIGQYPSWRAIASAASAGGLRLAP